MKKFTESEKKEIEAAVKEAELRTSGEIVPVVVETSADYSYVAHWLALGGLILATVLVACLPHFEEWLWELPLIFGAQALGWVAFWMIGHYPPVVRALAGRKRMGVEVHETAMASFLHNGLHRTQERTGILVFVSMLEHQVQILADEGIHTKSGQKFWDDEAALIAQGISQKEGGRAMARTIRKMGLALAEHFPARENDSNELPDGVRDR